MAQDCLHPTRLSDSRRVSLLSRPRNSGILDQHWSRSSTIQSYKRLTMRVLIDVGLQIGGAPAKVEEKKAEKTTFDVKLEKFDATSKINAINEVRTFTSLGLKEAKELVEKTPLLLKQGLTKEEAASIVEKIKVAGGVAVME